jgi:membrane-bound lytic murein transglycosylase MltF
MSRSDVLARWVLSLALLGSFACGRQEPLPAAAADEELPPDPMTEERRRLVQAWTGDLDGMIERRVIRLLVTPSRTHYFVDRGTQRGLTYEFGQLFENELNKKLNTGNLRIHVVFIPVAHDQLIPSLLEGRGDIAAANLTITPGRLDEVDFAAPTFRDVDEIVVTGPGTPVVASAEDLSGVEVYLRPSSSYFGSVTALNQRLQAAGKPPVTVREAPEVLSDEDILEMVNAGLVPATVVDRHIAEFWAQVFDSLTLNREAKLRTGGQIAPMVRRGSPQLVAAIDDFMASHGKGSAEGNILLQRYLRSTKYAASAIAPSERQKFEQTVELFRRYSDQYSMDYLLMVAQAYQESGLDQQAKSRVGAVGIMQIMPATGAELGVGDISQLEPNIHGGVKYIRWLIDHYFANEPMTPIDKGLFAFAAYNAGPGRIRQLRKRAADRGLDPNVWFNNVEVVAAEAIGRETVQYVSNIYKYYLAYTMLVERRRVVDAARADLAGTKVQ